MRGSGKAVPWTAAVAVAFVLQAAPAVSQINKVDPPEVAELMGAPVFAADGGEVGEVSAMSTSGEGEIMEIRVTTASPLGIGARTVVLPAGRYQMLRGAVIMDLSAEEFDALPSANKTRR